MSDRPAVPAGPHPSALAAVHEATRELLDADSPGDVLDVVLRLVAELGGQTVPARNAGPDALPWDLSFGVDEPMLPVAELASVPRLHLESLLPGFLEQARRVVMDLRSESQLHHEATRDTLTGLMTPPITTELVDTFLELIESRSSVAAARLAVSRLEAGLRPDAVILDLLVPAQRAVGARWQRAEWTVAHEHQATAVTDAALHQVAAAGGSRATDRGSLAVVCAEGDWHTLPSRMAAELLRLDGWDVVFLGGSVPPRDLHRWLSTARLDGLVLTCTLPTCARGVLSVASAVAPTGIPIVAGGCGMGPDGLRAASLGVGWVADLADVGTALATQVSPPDPRDLQRRIDDDLAAILRRDEIVRGAMRELRRTLPAMAGYTPAQLDRTAEDLGHILDAVAAAALTGDPRLLTDFLVWLGDVLSARGVPAGALAAGVHALSVVSPADAASLTAAQ